MACVHKIDIIPHYSKEVCFGKQKICETGGKNLDTIKLMNGSAWMFAALLIVMVVIQSLLFLRMALRFNKKHEVLTNEEVKLAVRTGSIAAIGPALSTITVALSLIAMVGSGVTFMRCGVIGAPAWELFMASTASSAAGVEFGSPEFTPAIFTLCIFGMTWASAPYFINTIITLKPLDSVANKAASSKNSRSFLPYLSAGAMAGLLGCSIMDYLTSIPSCAAIVVSGLVGYAVSTIAKKTNNSFLASLNMALGMIAAMFVGQLLTTIM